MFSGSLFPKFGFYPKGIPFVVGGIVLIVISSYFSSFFLNIATLLTLFLCFFFRDPARSIPPLDDVAVAPSDGIVVGIDEMDGDGVASYAFDKKSSDDLRDSLSGKWIRVSVCLNIFDVHVTKSPIDGMVKTVCYRAGQFLNAFSGEASARNESNSVVIDSRDGTIVIVRQIAGLLARRIECSASDGSGLSMGGNYGIIMFGSRVEMFLKKEDWETCIFKKQRMIGGETIVARRVSSI